MQIIKTDPKKPSSFQSFFAHIFRDHLFESSATLSYYFIFSVFPLAIFVSAAFSTLDISPESLAYLSRFIPDQILTFFHAYLKEISLGNTSSLIILGFILTIYSMGKVIQTMKRKFRLAYQVYPKIPLWKEWLVSLVFVVLMLFSFYATLILIIAGNHIAGWVLSIFPFSIVEKGMAFFQFLRYFIVTAYLGFVLFGLYYVLPGIKLKRRYVLPGTFFALAAWLVMSYLFSFYFSRIRDYTTLYGSLGTIIALLTWLFFINTILLVGAYINSYLYLKNADKTP